MPAEKKQLAIVVKYFLPLDRISGIIAYLQVLNRELLHEWQLTIVTSLAGQNGPKVTQIDGYPVHRVKGPFPISAALEVRKIKPDAVLVVSGIEEVRKAALYYAPFEAIIGKIPQVFYQATNVDRSPGYALQTVLRRSKSVLCAGQEIYNHFNPAFPNKTILAIPSVDIEKLSSIKPEHKPRTLRIGFVNHFNSVKGADIAFEICDRLSKKYESIDFVLAGKGELEAEMITRYSPNPAIDIRGYLNENDRLSLIASCDLMILPFRTGVSVLGLSQTLLECMAMGVVCLVSDTDALAPALESGSDGLICYTTQDYFNNAEMLINDNDLLAKYRSLAVENAIQKYDIKTVSKLITTSLNASIPQQIA